MSEVDELTWSVAYQDFVGIDQAAVFWVQRADSSTGAIPVNGGVQAHTERIQSPSRGREDEGC